MHKFQLHQSLLCFTHVKKLQQACARIYIIILDPDDDDDDRAYVCNITLWLTPHFN